MKHAQRAVALRPNSTEQLADLFVQSEETLARIEARFGDYVTPSLRYNTCSRCLEAHRR